MKKESIYNSIINNDSDYINLNDKDIIYNIIKEKFNKRLFSILENNYTDVFNFISKSLDYLQSKSGKININDMSDEIEEIRSMNSYLENIIKTVYANIKKFLEQKEIRYSTINRLTQTIENEAVQITKYIEKILYTIDALDHELDNIIKTQDDFLINQQFNKAFTQSKDLSSNLSQVINRQKEVSKEIKELYAKYN